jgi:hypothetical protein
MVRDGFGLAGDIMCVCERVMVGIVWFLCEGVFVRSKQND